MAMLILLALAVVCICVAFYGIRDTNENAAYPWVPNDTPDKVKAKLYQEAEEKKARGKKKRTTWDIIWGLYPDD